MWKWAYVVSLSSYVDQSDLQLIIYISGGYESKITAFPFEENTRIIVPFHSFKSNAWQGLGLTDQKNKKIWFVSNEIIPPKKKTVNIYSPSRHFKHKWN